MQDLFVPTCRLDLSHVAGEHEDVSRWRWMLEEVGDKEREGGARERGPIVNRTRADRLNGPIAELGLAISPADQSLPVRKELALPLRRSNGGGAGEPYS